jgi:hypothetical protein
METQETQNVVTEQQALDPDLPPDGPDRDAEVARRTAEQAQLVARLNATPRRDHDQPVRTVRVTGGDKPDVDVAVPMAAQDDPDTAALIAGVVDGISSPVQKAERQRARQRQEIAEALSSHEKVARRTLAELVAVMAECVPILPLLTKLAPDSPEWLKAVVPNERGSLRGAWVTLRDLPNVKASLANAVKEISTRLSQYPTVSGAALRARELAQMIDGSVGYPDRCKQARREILAWAKRMNGGSSNG